MYILEIQTTTGRICERHETYEAALNRLRQLPDECVVGLPLIFRELADGSQRLVREDGKPLQWHRLPVDPPPGPDEPLPLSDLPPELMPDGSGPPRVRALHPARWDEDDQTP